MYQTHKLSEIVSDLDSEFLYNDKSNAFGKQPKGLNFNVNSTPGPCLYNV